MAEAGISNPRAKAPGFLKEGPRLPARVGRKPETTLTETFKTDVRLLPRFGPLEGQAVDNPRGRDETGLTETLLGKLGVLGWPAPERHLLCQHEAVEVQALRAWRRPILLIDAAGRAAHQRTRLDRFGCPARHLSAGWAGRPISDRQHGSRGHLGWQECGDVRCRGRNPSQQIASIFKLPMV